MVTINRKIKKKGFAFLISLPLKSQRKVIKTHANKVNWNKNLVVLQKGAYLRNRSDLAVNCCVIIHCLEVSCKEDQIMSAQQHSPAKL